MITAVDTSAILAIFKQEPRAEAWLLLLAAAARSGPLVISEVVFAELAAFFVRAKDLTYRLDSLAIELLPSSKTTLFEAGQVFSSYRQAGGVRTTMVPDFLIGAHALTQAQQLASADRGYLQKHFSGLKVVSVGER